MSKRHERQQRKRHEFGRRGMHYQVALEIEHLPHMKQRIFYRVQDCDTGEFLGARYNEWETAERIVSRLNRTEK